VSAKKAAKVETAAELAAMSKAQLADAYGPIATRLKPLEKRAKLYKEEFERRGLSLLVGDKWSIQKSEGAPYPKVDLAKARAALGAVWCEANSKPVVAVSWKATALTEADNDEAAA
jgi:hypothetical protein